MVAAARARESGRGRRRIVRRFRLLFSRFPSSSWPSETIPAGRLYDGALVCEVLEHLSPEDGLALLKQVKAVCKPGAMVCVTVPLDTGSRSVYPGHLRQFDRMTLAHIMIEAGFISRFSTDIKGIWLLAEYHA